MIEGITKPFDAQAILMSDQDRQAAATAYLAGMAGLFAKFDPETGGNDILSIHAPFDVDEKGVSATAERGSNLLHIIAPDTQMHMYRLQGDNTEAWREDGQTLDSLVQSPTIERMLPGDASPAEQLQHLKDFNAEREVLAHYEPRGRFVDEEEVQKLFALLMQGTVSREVSGWGE